jgi:DNA-binding ferritin-like protein
LAEHAERILMLTENARDETENILRKSKIKLCVFADYAKVA